MKFPKIIFQLSFVLFIFCVCPYILLAQNSKKIKIFPDNCETISGKLDVTGIKFNKLGENESYLIIIGGSSKGEKSRYNDNRITDAVKYLTEFHKIKSERIIYGTRKLSDKLGYLQFFVNGKLLVEIRFSKKAELCFGIGETFR